MKRIYGAIRLWSGATIPDRDSLPPRPPHLIKAQQQNVAGRVAASGRKN
jgi:hypothetical protein